MEGQVESKLRLEASLEGQEAPKMLQEAPKTLQEAPKRLQVGLQRRPRAAQDAPRGARDAPRAAQDAPRGSKLGSKDVQEASKSDKTAVQAQFDSKQRHLIKTMVFTRRINVFAGQERSRRPVGRAKWSPSGAWRPLGEHLGGSWSPLGVQDSLGKGLEGVQEGPRAVQEAFKRHKRRASGVQQASKRHLERKKKVSPVVPLWKNPRHLGRT